MSVRTIAIALTWCFVFMGAMPGAYGYTYTDLIGGLTDLEGVAALPGPGERCAQFSSYDRRSRYDETTGKYVGWSENSDHTGIVRKEGDSEVLAEMEGPGCIWRIWSARVGEGHVRIYLDGAKEPAVDLPFVGYFNRRNAPFVYPSLVHETAKGFNSYIPIPFSKSCRVVADKGWGAYYHFTYSTYPEGTVMPTFTRDLSRQETAALEAADKFLTSQLGSDPAGKREREISISPVVRLRAGGSARVAQLLGPKAITCIRAMIAPKDLSPAKLRNVALRIYWDGERSPSVWAPVGDFFGSGPGYNPYRSLPLGMTAEGLYSFWYMPFARSARIELVNDGDEDFDCRLEVTTAPLARPISELGYFHAKWHRDEFLPEEPERLPDWTVLKTKGRGRFCGMMLEVWNPKAQWWGEGDEKFFVDGEKFPSTFGTGSEDYFGYAWTCEKLFENAYHNQTKCEGAHQGHISNNRWHIVDNVPFQTSFEGYIEKYFLNERPTLYACMAYWYLAPGGEDKYALPPNRSNWYVQPVVYKVDGVMEGEKLPILEMTSGYTVPQDMLWLGDRWSNWHDLTWADVKLGDRLAVGFDAESAGQYDLIAQFTRGPGYAVVQLSLDGGKIGVPIDLHREVAEPSGEMLLGSYQLGSGEHKLTVEVTGGRAQAARWFFGLDYVKLVPRQ